MAYHSKDLTHLLIDLDETLYPREADVWARISVRIDRFMVDMVGIAPEDARATRRRLFNTYGTTLRGLKIENDIDVQHYLDYVHDISLEGVLTPSPRLRELLGRYPQHKWILTNASREHAEHVLTALQLRDQFEGIIDIWALQPWCKPFPEAFRIALDLCGQPQPEHCLFIDDSARNLDTAAELKLKTVLIDEQPSLLHPTIRRIEDLDQVLYVE